MTPFAYRAVDPRGRIVRGRLDASGQAPAAPNARRELVDACRQIAATGHGPAEQVASMGCSIKWRA